GRGHRRAGHESVTVAGQRRADRLPRSGEVRLDLTVLARSAAGEVGDPIVTAAGTHGIVEDAAPWCYAPRVLGPVGAVGPDPEDARRLPRLEDVLHQGIVRREPRSPRVVDDVRTFGDIRVLPLAVRRREHPLGRLDQVGLAARRATVRGDPGDTGRDTDL